TFWTHGCEGSWLLHCTAIYAGGVLEFDRPVQEYSQRAYRKLYAARIQGQDYLLSAGVAPDLRKYLFLDGLPVVTTGLFHRETQDLSRWLDRSDLHETMRASLVEQEIDRWEPGLGDAPAPTAGMLAADVNVTGTWSFPGDRYESTTLRIRRVPDRGD